jgi:hypothetical protein
MTPDLAQPEPPDPPPERQVNIARTAEHVRMCLQRSIERVQANRRSNQRRASFVKVATILLSGLATVLLGLQLQSNVETYLKQAAFIFGACVTMLNALEPFFNFRSLWVEHERALAALYQIQADLDFFLSGIPERDADISKLEDFHRRQQEVWSDLSNVWLRARSDKGGNK